MDVYRLKPEGLAAELAPHVWRMVGGLLYVEAVVALALLLFVRPAPSPALLAEVLLVVACLWAISFRRMIARNRAAWNVYALELAEDGRLRLHREGQDLWLGREEVARIVEFPGHGLFLLKDQSTLLVKVSQMVERYEEVRERLAQWRPIEQGTRHTRVHPRLIVSLGLLFLGMWLSVGYVPAVWWAMIPGVLVLAVTTHCIVRMARTEDMPRSTRAVLIGWLVLLGIGGPVRLGLTLMTRLLAPEAP